MTQEFDVTIVGISGETYNFSVSEEEKDKFIKNISDCDMRFFTLQHLVLFPDHIESVYIRFGRQRI